MGYSWTEWDSGAVLGAQPVTVGHGAVWDLRDPAHDPAEFLVLIEQAHWPALRLPMRETLPPVFGGVDPPAPEFEGEVLFEPPPAV